MGYLDIRGTYNIRDLGGTIVSDSETIKNTVLLRSGNLDKLPEKSQQQLIDYGVKTVIDLRDEWEIDLYPNIFENSDAASYHNLPLIGDALSHDSDWQRETGEYVELHELYIKYIDGCQTQIGKIISTIADSETGIIVHCYAGKDRTGIITALVLASIGVDDKVIATDYALSFQNIQHLVKEWREYAIENGRDLEQLERDAGSKPETMIQVFKHIRQQYRGINQFLTNCGVSKTQLQQIRTKFTSKSSN